MPKHAPDTGINLVWCRVCETNVYDMAKDEWREATARETWGKVNHGEVFFSVCPCCSNEEETKGL